MAYDINKYLNEIEKNINKQLSEISDEETEAFINRAYTDTLNLFNKCEQNDFKKVTYIIYRSYILGMIIERIKNKNLNLIKK